MWVHMDSEHTPDSYMHHAYKFAKTHSSGLKQNVEDYWNRMGRPDRFDPHQAHDFFRQLMREGRADEVNAVHQRAGEKWEAFGDMVRDHARHRGLSSAEWARAAFGPAPPSDVFRIGSGASSSALGSDQMAMANQATAASQARHRVVVSARS